jgi:hypothetical protein
MGGIIAPPVCVPSRAMVNKGQMGAVQAREALLESQGFAGFTGKRGVNALKKLSIFIFDLAQIFRKSWILPVQSHFNGADHNQR